jgi:hypothetical protein
MKPNYKKKSSPHSDEIVSDGKFLPESGKIQGVEKFEELVVFSYECASYGRNTRTKISKLTMIY